MLDALPPLPESVADELRSLADKACAQAITGEEFQRLVTMLRDQPAAQSYWLAYLAIDARLRREFGWAGHAMPEIFADSAAGAPCEADLASDARPTIALAAGGGARRRTARRWMIGATMTAGLLLALTAIYLFEVRAPDSPAQAPEAVATLTGGMGFEWADNRDAPTLGEGLSIARHGLAVGMAEITFRNGAVAVLEAPAEIEILGPDRAFVHSGQVVVRAEGMARGFVLETARATVIDLGTEFGVKVNASRDTEVHVFEGSVTTREKTGDLAAAEQHLRAGQAIHYAVAANVPPQRSPSAPERFVRRFPDPDPRRKGTPFNQSRFDWIRVTAAPGQVVIDGDLSEWNRRGTFRAACEPPYGETYFVEGRMMYDRQCLYLGAHVGDPSPMLSTIDPAIDADRAWRGGAIQVRLSTDRSRPWPLEAEWPSKPGDKRPVRPGDISNRLAHLTLWYFAPAQHACLGIVYGMDLHGQVVNPAGYRGAYRRDVDGRGYVVEYAIAWPLLSAADDPPRPGDVLAVTWGVHWSNQSGRLWQGHLTEILNPQESGRTYLRAATWGRAVYE